MNSITFTFLYVSLVKVVQVMSMIYEKKWKYFFLKHIVCHETQTHDLNLNGYTLFPKG